MRRQLFEWTKQMFEFALAQGFGQIAGMASGLIYVRYMPVDEYAIYALSLASLSMVSVGSDLGLTGSLNYFWRHSKQDWDALAPRISVVRRLRVIFLLLSALVCAVLLFKTAVAQKLTLASVMGILLLVILTAALQMRSAVDIRLLRLRGLQRKSYYPDFAGSITRLLLAAGMIASGITTAWFGLIGGLAGAITTVLVVHLIVGKSHHVPAVVDRDTWREMASYLLPVLPGVLVFMVQAPLILWMAATYGDNTVVAEVFAIGRIAAVFGLLGSFIVVVVTPRLARIVGDDHFTKVWLYLLAVLTVISVIAVMLTLMWPWIPLLLIGKTYAHLSNEIVIAIATASISVILTFLVLANRVRGWVRLDPYVAAVQSTIILVCVMIWSFESTQNVLVLSLLLITLQAIMTLGIGVTGLVKPLIVSNR